MATDSNIGGYLRSADPPHELWSGFSVSQDESSQPIRLVKNGHGKVCFHVNITNTDLVGTLHIEGNNAPDDANLNWVSLQTQAISSGVDVDAILVDEKDAGYMRVRIDHTSGSGTITVVAVQDISI